MKRIKKSTAHEPTITDVIGVVQNLSVSVQDLAEAMQTGFAKVEDRFDGIDSNLVEMNDRFRSVEKGHAETHRCLDSIERKQDGMLESLDETVHRSEFVKLVQRVEVLEK